MKPFDYEAAKNGAKVCTRNGRPVRIICWDARGKYPIIALVDEDQKEVNASYTNNGYLCINCKESDYDLMMAEEEPKCTLKPFDKVLVRDNYGSVWNISFFCRRYDDKSAKYPYICIGESCFSQCIPYEGNEDLLGTNKAPKKC